MGFIPILITLSGAIMLFLMVVNYHLKSKKNDITQLQLEVIHGLGKFGDPKTIKEPESSVEFKAIDNQYQLIKQSVRENQLAKFEDEVRTPYLKAKLQAAQYNTLLKTKPYSFVARLLGHRPV